MAATFALLLPAVFVFGLYHLMTWFNVFRINSRTFWRRLALASGTAHVILATGFLVFSYVDYSMNREAAFSDLSFESYVFLRSEFWRLGVFFDLIPTLLLVGFFSLLDRLGLGFSFFLVFAWAVIYVVGTLQWYWVGGGLGAAAERIWEGLKTTDEDEPDDEWQWPASG